ncbi:glycosyl hydrolase 53 family protein [Micromonospora sp. KC213]|uniref:glycosyl hydrolase 53 family protein n=1 Tax=Micromonospora sp. KC213 TaxID=2530378 RepID=UPI00140429C6|nr:glycosyl hydrolase 53 family protein [Micromonospora sp. KC213]
MSGMVDRIGLSYYPDWHGSYAVVQRDLVEIAKVLPGVKLNMAEMSPPSSGRVTNTLSDPNHPVGFTDTVQSQGSDTMAAMKTINDIPDNAGTGVAVGWHQRLRNGVGCKRHLRASFKVWNDAFAKNVVEEPRLCPDAGACGSRAPHNREKPRPAHGCPLDRQGHLECHQPGELRHVRHLHSERHPRTSPASAAVKEPR